MRVLMIGASGFIGSYLRRRLTQNTSLKVISTYNANMPKGMDESWLPLQITDQHRLQQIFRDIRPDIVILLAAIADVKTAEMVPEEAKNVNTEGARQISILCTRHNARLIFLSSEYVFKGDRGYYKEHEEPNPNTHYGRTKWEAELAVAEQASNWSIVRTSLVFGIPIAGRQNLATVIADRLKNGETYEGGTGTYRTPIYVEHLTQGIAKLVADYHPGIFHIAGTNWMNMYQFSLAVAEVLDLDRSLIRPVPELGDLHSTPPPKRPDPVFIPDILGLDSNQTIQRLKLPAYDVVAGLTEMLR